MPTIFRDAADRQTEDTFKTCLAILRICDGRDLGLQDFAALSAVRLRGPCCVGDIQRAIGVLAAHMSRIIRRLEDRGLITYELDQRDRRRAVVALSAAGQTLVRDIVDAFCTSGKLWTAM